MVNSASAAAFGRLARLLLLILLVAAVPVRGVAEASVHCSTGAAGGASQAVSAGGSTAPVPPGHDGGGISELSAEVQCAVGVALSTSITPSARLLPSGGVAPSVVLASSGFVPDGLYRPPLGFAV